jgi:hypothetical protein
MHGRLVPQLDPRLAEPVVVLDAVDRLEHLADVGPRVHDAVVRADAGQPAPRVEPGADEDRGGQVGQEEEEVQARAEGRDDERGDEEEETEMTGEEAHGRCVS